MEFFMKKLICVFFLFVPCFAQDEEEFRKNLARSPKNMELYINYIETLSNSQKINDIGNEAVAVLGDSFNLFTAIGNAYINNANDARRAIVSFRRAQALNPRSATGYYRLGQALLRTGNFRQAEVSFKAAVSYTGSANARSTYLSYVGIALEKSKDLAQAVKYYDESLKINPNNTIAKEGKDRVQR